LADLLADVSGFNDLWIVADVMAVYAFDMEAQICGSDQIWPMFWPMFRALPTTPLRLTPVG
jgi:hypothetical protein